MEFIKNIYGIYLAYQPEVIIYPLTCSVNKEVEAKCHKLQPILLYIFNKYMHFYANTLQKSIFSSLQVCAPLELSKFILYNRSREVKYEIKNYCNYK